MVSPNPRRLLTVAAVAASLMILTACVDDPQTSAGPTASTAAVTGEPTRAPSPTGAATSAGDSAYPGNARDYGLAILASIASSNDTLIAELSNANTATYINAQHYKAKNGQWTHAICDSGGTQYCHYYNQTGDFASVGVDTAKLGRAGAVSSVTIEANSFATYVVDYVQQFVHNWTYGTGYVRMRAYATQEVVDALATAPKLTDFGGDIHVTPTPCPALEGRLCVSAGALGGTETIGYGFVVDRNKVGQPNAIVGVPGLT